ncbi:MAG TPA: 6-carboxytetrahydropterin synthase [Ideonella sp.]|uniref:6-carboxytetrahydropterin synthase n=1 Tax=Ideonella sp. TaxID=1929293 RepID=UPI002E366F2B|nr:6-carboxytetrahydropterin synthase [Ideonella sp.]HEX5683894.1 6-carboxytetrahydropterin synthase [Ideonella sp.]
MSSRQFFTAQAGFDAARQLHNLPSGHRALRLHGHSFQVRVRAALSEGWAPFPGGELSRLQSMLADVIAPLDHVLLNELVDEPCDDGLARWIAGQLRLPQTPAIGLQSSANSGVDVDGRGVAHAWRRYRFQSAHRLPNVPLGHKCGRMHGHGFEAVVHLRAAPGEPTHAACDRLDELWAPLHHQLNYACLNELPGLENPTSEMLSRWLWQRLVAGTDGLTAVRVYETASCGAQYDGATHRIWKDFHLDSALRLRRAPPGSPLSGLHGHTYTLRLHLSAELDELRGWAVDFGDVKELFKPVFKALDHHPLHDIPDLLDCDAASLARWVLAQAQARLPQVSRVDLFETEGCGAIVCTGDAEPVLAA